MFGLKVRSCGSLTGLPSGYPFPTPPRTRCVSINQHLCSEHHISVEVSAFPEAAAFPMVEMVARENDKQLAGLFIFIFFRSFLFGGLCLTFWERPRPFVVIFGRRFHPLRWESSASTSERFTGANLASACGLVL